MLKPFAKVKVELIAKSGWKREFKTDEEGAFKATLPWRGSTRAPGLAPVTTRILNDPFQLGFLSRTVIT